MKLTVSAGALVALSIVTACSGTDAAPPAPIDAAPPVGPDDAGADVQTSAPPLSPPRIVSAGGAVVAAPKLLMVTFGNEPLAAELETFAKTIGATPYWKDVTSEYGVGPATFARSVNIPEAPATIAQRANETWLIDQLDGTHPEWGTPDASTIVTVVYPKTTTVTVSGTSSCSSSPAWHGELKLKSGVRVPYATLTRCDPFVGLDGIDFVTAGLSHEWIEASTNPFYASNPAYNAATNEDAHWTAATFGELADMCANTPTVYAKPAGFPFTVQRSWSNASAAAGHDPCVPQPKAPYFIAATTTGEKIAIGGVVNAETVRGIVVPVGGSRTVDIAMYSDGPTAGPWAVKARDYAQRLGEKTDLTFAWDKASGVGGDTLHLTITRIKKDEQLGGAAMFEILSTLGTRQSVWVAAVGDAAR